MKSIYILTLSLLISSLTLAGKEKVVYQTANLIITKLSANVFEHTSFLKTDDFGTVPCNGMIVRESDEAIVFDTPVDDVSSEELINWISETLHCKITAVVATHFHMDCLGGLQAFHQHGIPSYASAQTIELAKKNKFNIPENSIGNTFTFRVGTKEVHTRYFGKGHTSDNIVAYFPDEHTLFGGCLIKERKAGKGYLGDADTKEWPATVQQIKQAFPDVKTVIPGHGKTGNKKLLDYTIRLFEEEVTSTAK
ncbi:MAG: subclass B1 metallo-beta-lactamase [Crocinitomicaceae bacterium]|nr:subclass B1 metallo-beta-lactamase [Crocinitomicaceae bacterium]